MQKNNNRVVEKIKNTVLSYSLIDKGDHIILGLSGGPDSVCLFFALYLLQEDFDITIEAVHVNHKFRPGAAEEDQEYVERLCQKLNVPCHVFTYDCGKIAKEEGISGEEAGRKARYNSFDHVALEIGEPVKIAVAQNANDQTETLLFRLMRGTGTDGLAAIEYKRKSEKGFDIIRPLLDVTRKEIEEFCASQGLTPRIDLTNLEPIYSRNKIRLGLIPYIEENFNANITNTLNRLAKIAREDKAYLWQQADSAYEWALVREKSGDDSAIIIDNEKLKQMADAISHRVVMKCFRNLGLEQDILAVHIEGAGELIKKGQTGTTIEFPKGYEMTISYGKAIFRAKKTKTDSEAAESLMQWEKEKILTPHDKKRQNCYLTDKNETLKLKCEIVTKLEYTKMKAIGQLETAIKEKRLMEVDYGSLVKKYGKNAPMPILRKRREGDYLYIKGHTKKIQDFFVDTKVPRDKRNEITMACLGNEVLWIIGEETASKDQGLKINRFTANYRVLKETEQVLLLEVQRNL